MLRRLLGLTPYWFQNELRRIRYRWQIKKDRFSTTEPEFDRLEDLLDESDWVIDIGANVGHYTIKMSDLVGKSGRVIAFEPVPTTFNHLSQNTQYCRHENITLLNVAVSDKFSLARMDVPTQSSGMKNYYESRIVDDLSIEDANQTVLTLAIDDLQIDHRIALIKIDAEGHEPTIFEGLKNILTRDRPIIIVETVNEEIRTLLEALNYHEERFVNSPNVVFRQ